MKKCVLCQSERLKISERTSQLIPGAKYAACLDCGNVNLIVNDVMIPTPESDTETTKALIKDAAEALGTAGLMKVSLTAENPADIEKLKLTISNYVKNVLGETDEEDVCDTCGECPCICDDLIEEDLDECDYDCDNCDEGCPDFEEKKAAALDAGLPILEERITEECCIDSLPVKEVTISQTKRMNTLFDEKNKTYLLVMPDGTKKTFENCSKEFILNIINDIGTHVKLYEMKEVKLKERITYDF